MNRRYFAVLLISGILLVAAIPLAITLSNPSADFDTSRYIPMYVLENADKNRDEIEEPRSKYVLDELIVRFKRGVTEEEIACMHLNSLTVYPDL